MLGAARGARKQPSSASAAPTIENGAGLGEYSGTDTVSCTVTAGNRLVAVVFSETATHDAVAYGAQSMSLIGTVEAGGNRVSIWQLTNPTIGTANVVVTTSTGTIRVGVLAVSLVGAGPAQAATGSSSANATVTSTTATFTVDTSNSLVLDGLCIGNANNTCIADASQTTLVGAPTDTGGATSADRGAVGASCKVASSGSVSMIWDTSAGTTLRHAHLAVAFPPG